MSPAALLMETKNRRPTQALSSVWDSGFYNFTVCFS